MKKMSKKQQESSMPEALLTNISEWSYGGYVLFSFDGEGRPQVHSSAPDELNAMSLQFFIRGWSKAMDEISRESFLQNIAESVRGDDEDEEDGEEI
jgi:hypothetical protein